MRKVKPVKLKNLTLDGKNIYVQSMLNVISTDIEGNVRQAKELERAGCEIIRVSIPDENSFPRSKMRSACPWSRTFILIINSRLLPASGG